MSNRLLNYMNRRLGNQNELASPRIQGPVITISREVGCGGVEIARLLSEELNRRQLFTSDPWQVISKEVLNRSATELKLNPERVHRIFSGGTLVFDEILASLTTKYYKNSRMIIRSVRRVIRNLALEGNSIIVGRAGNVIAADLENSLHLRFTAPLEWRIQSISDTQNMSRAESMEYIRETDRKKEYYRQYFMDSKHPDDTFDLSVDVSRFSREQVIELIISAFEIKGIPLRMKQFARQSNSVSIP